MNELKTKRMIVAVTVGAILLLIVLFAIMIYQMIAIRAEKKRIDYYIAKTMEYKELTKEGEETIETRSMWEWIEREARKYGYVKPSR